MNTLLIILMCLFVVAMFLVEIFFIPGIGFFGVAGGLAFVGVTYYLFAYFSWKVGALFVISCVILFALGFYFLSRSKWIDRMSLHTSIDDHVNKMPTDIMVGSRGKADSRLALTGRVRSGSDIFEATSERGFIEEGTEVVVSRIENDKIYVQPANINS